MALFDHRVHDAGFPDPADAIDVRIQASAHRTTTKFLMSFSVPALERIHYMGEAVALVIGKSVHAARDRAEAVKRRWNSRFVLQKARG
jgi:hypothetical protein